MRHAHSRLYCLAVHPRHVGIVGSALVGAVRFQSSKISFFSPGDADATLVSGFQTGLKELGYSEGRNILIDYRWGRGGSRVSLNSRRNFSIHRSMSSWR